MYKLSEKISVHAFDDIKENVKEQVGEDASRYIFPAVVEALENGDGRIRADILLKWLDVDSCRVCTECGSIMEEGWYLNDLGYACSDKCAAKIEGLSTDEFKRYRIYKHDILEYLKSDYCKPEHQGRTIESLSLQECDDIIDFWCSNCDYYFTEWY